MAILSQGWGIVKQGRGRGVTSLFRLGASQIGTVDQHQYWMEGGEGENTSHNKEVNLSFMHGNRRPAGKKINPPPNTQQERWERGAPSYAEGAGLSCSKVP
jgi:hypothetical protein